MATNFTNDPFSHYVDPAEPTHRLIQTGACFIGVLSSILTLATMIKNKDFSDCCFRCYEAIAVIEIFYCIACGFFTLYDILPKFFKHQLTWVWFRELCVIFRDCFGDSVTIIIIFLSIHRAIACLWPLKFSRVNKRWLCYFIIVFSVLFTIWPQIPTFFTFYVDRVNGTMEYFVVYKNQPREGFVIVKPREGQAVPAPATLPPADVITTMRRGFRVTVAVGVIASSVLACAGMVKVAVLK